MCAIKRAAYGVGRPTAPEPITEKQQPLRTVAARRPLVILSVHPYSLMGGSGAHSHHLGHCLVARGHMQPDGARARPRRFFDGRGREAPGTSAAACGGGALSGSPPRRAAAQCGARRARARKRALSVPLRPPVGVAMCPCT